MQGKSTNYVVALVFAATSIAADTREGALNEGCLYGDAESAATGAPVPDNCPDTLKAGESAHIRLFADALGIQQSELKFNGCKSTPFLTRRRDGLGGPTTYDIFYPSEATRIEDILGPLAHELGHVYQLKASGGAAALTARWKSIDIELGADFLSGLTLQRTIPGLETRAFQHSLYLVGKRSEKDADPQAHGSLSQRAQAFRSGYFLDLDKFGNALAESYTEFTANRLRRIKSQE